MSKVFTKGDKNLADNISALFIDYFTKNLEKEKIFEFRDYRVENLASNSYDLKLIGNGIRIYTKFIFFLDFNEEIFLDKTSKKELMSELDEILKIEKEGKCTTLLLISNSGDEIYIKNKNILLKLNELFTIGTEIIGYKIFLEEENIKNIKRIPIKYD